MSEEKRRILIVDDSTDDIHVLMENLKQDYAVLAATSGEKALEMAAKDPQPDLILMDVSMPGMNGYETCQRLKGDPATQMIDVIFVSAHNTTDEKLAGYDAGGSDYLIKPVQPAELQQKVKLAIHNSDAQTEVAAEKDMAMQTAMTAITSAGEQGVVLDFMRRSFSVSSIEDLAKLIVEATGNYGLENSAQIRGSRALFNASTTEPISPLEEELLHRLKDAGRLRENGANFVMNFGPITQLIKNMPEDEEKRGRLRDHLAILLEGAEATLRTLEMQQEITQMVYESNRALQNIQAMQKAQKDKGMQIMDNVMMNMEESLFNYGLTEEQENLLRKIVQTGVDDSLENLEQGVKIDDQLHEIIDRLTTIAKS